MTSSREREREGEKKREKDRERDLWKKKNISFYVSFTALFCKKGYFYFALGPTNS